MASKKSMLKRVIYEREVAIGSISGCGRGVGNRHLNERRIVAPCHFLNVGDAY